MSENLKQRIKQSADFESPAVEAMLNLMVAADYLRSRINRICSEFGITNGQYNVLRILRGAGAEGHARCEIAARMLERAPDITRIVDRLEKQNLVMRDRSEEDRRQSVTRISEKGLELLAQIDPLMADGDRFLTYKLSLPECIALTSICEKIYQK